MAHQRKIIRDKIVALLVDQTVAGARVYPARRLPNRKADLPALLVYAEDETVDPASHTTAPRELARELEVVIDGLVTANTELELEDAIDAIALEIETVMHADPFLGGTAADSALLGTVTDIDIVGDRLVGLARLSYRVEYQTIAPEPPAALDDFTTVHATHNLGNQVHQNEDAEDEFTVQELP